MDKEAVLKAVSIEMDRSIAKHGDWSDLSVDSMMVIILREWWELVAAHDADDVAGPHGMLQEATQVAACLVKMLVQLAQREAADEVQIIQGPRDPIYCSGFKCAGRLRS